MSATPEAIAELLAEHPGHENCDVPWFCEGCERPVCPRCEVSPGEPDLCPECWWIADPEGEAE